MEVERIHDPQQQALRATASGIRPAAGLLAVLYSLLAVARLVQSPPDVAVALSAMAAVNAVLLGTLWWLERRRRTPLRWVPHLAGGIGALAAINVMGNVLLTGDPLQSMSVTLIVVGVGALVEHRGWAAGVITATLAVWGVAAYLFPAPAWRQLAVGVLSSALLALVLRAVFLANKRSLEQARQDAADLAIKDELTGLLNRRGLEVVADKALATARRLKLPIAMLFIDLDNMKVLNDTQGHLAGDARLAETGRRLSSMFRDADAVARVGGDEFAVLLVGVPPEELAMMQDRACNGLEDASVGVSAADHPVSTSLVELMHGADGEMYRNKQARRASI